MAGFQFNWRYLTHVCNFHICTAYKNKHVLGFMKQYLNTGIKSLTDVAVLCKPCATSKVSPSEKIIVSLSRLSLRTGYLHKILLNILKIIIGLCDFIADWRTFICLKFNCYIFCIYAEFHISHSMGPMLVSQR